MHAFGHMQHRDDRQPVVRLVCIAGKDGPYQPLRRLSQRYRRAAEQNLPFGQHRHIPAGLADIFDEVRREDHHPVSGHVHQQVAEANALFLVQPGGRLIDNENARVVDQRLEKRIELRFPAFLSLFLEFAMPLMDPEFIEITRDLDIEAFWEENARCGAFTTAKPRCALSFAPDDHWLFEFLAAPSTLRYYRDKPYRDALHQEANALTRAWVGQAFFEEDTWETSPKRIENLFGCEFGYYEGGTPWLMPVTDDPRAFDAILDQAERTDLRAWALPEDFLEEWETRRAQGRSLLKLGTGSRGPATIMTSVIRPETLFLWCYDYPEQMRRFCDLLAQKMVELNQVLRAFSGNAEPGWWITDDNSALFNRKLYRAYCYPVLERVLAAMAPGGAARYQHSDSAMGHLLDQQVALGIRMEIQLYPVDRVYGGNLTCPAEYAREVMQRYRERLRSAPDNLTTSVVLINFPPIPQLPEMLRGKSFAISWCTAATPGWSKKAKR